MDGIDLDEHNNIDNNNNSKTHNYIRVVKKGGRKRRKGNKYMKTFNYIILNIMIITINIL